MRTHLFALSVHNADEPIVREADYFAAPAGGVLPDGS